MAQMSAIGLLALAGLLAAMPTKDAAPAPGVAKQPEGPGTTPPSVPDAPALDLSIATGVMDQRVHRQPLIVAQNPDGPGEEGKTEDPPQGPHEGLPPQDHIGGPPHFRYITFASTGRRDYAILEFDNGDKKVTKTLTQGKYLDDAQEYLLLGVSAEKLIVADCDNNTYEHFIVDRATNPPPEATMQTGNVVGINGNGSHMNNGKMPEAKSFEVPGNMNDPQEWERIRKANEDKKREMMERRDGRLGNSTTAAPPPRPGTNANQVPKPTTPTTPPAPKGNTKPDSK